MAEDSEAVRERMGEALRAWYAVFSELGREFGRHLRMHASDAAALVHITTAEDRGTPLTQTQLARRIGLTTAATSSLLNRLEEAGHIERHRNQADRRLVTLRSTQAMHHEVHTFFASAARDVDQITAAYADEEITSFTKLITSMTAVLERHLDERTNLESR